MKRNSMENMFIDFEHRGNGYDGYSMSNNARIAYDNGEKPLSKWTKSEIVEAVYEINPSINLSKVNLETLKSRFLFNSGWHHTSKHYNVTNFYSVYEDYIQALTQDDIDDIVAYQISKPKAKRDSSVDSEVDKIYDKVLIIAAAGILTEDGAIRRFIYGKDFNKAYNKAVNNIRQKDTSRVNQWRKLPPDHYRHKDVSLFDNDIDGYIIKEYAFGKKLSRNSKNFKAIAQCVKNNAAKSSD